MGATSAIQMMWAASKATISSAPGTWPASGRYTSLNGEIIPQFPTVQGRLERWRVIHAGVRDTISLQFFKVRPGKLKDGQLPLLKTAAAAKLIQQTCGTTPLPYTLIAADGLTLGQAQSTTLATFQPGYRFDALTVFPEAGQYCVLDSSAPKSGAVNALDVGPRLMAIVDVAPGTPVNDVPAYIQTRLIALAELNLPPRHQGSSRRRPPERHETHALHATSRCHRERDHRHAGAHLLHRHRHQEHPVRSGQHAELRRCAPL